MVVFSQEETTFSFLYNNVPLSAVLTDLEDSYKVRFSYNDETIKQVNISLDLKDSELKAVLTEITKQTKMEFNFIDERYIFVVKGSLENRPIEQLEGVLIKGYLTQGINKGLNGVFVIEPSRLGLLPGLTEADVLESIQQLPGVVSPNETASGMIVRGGNYDQNSILFDEIPIYHKGHLFGMISPFNPNAVAKISFYNKGAHPRYGERVSSIVKIETTNKISNTSKFSAGFNGIRANAVIEAPIIKNKLGIQTSFSRSFNELYQSVTFDQLAEKVFQDSRILDANTNANSFYFFDTNVKINYLLNEKNNLAISAFYVDNNLDYEVKSTNSKASLFDKLNSNNEGYSFQWKSGWNNKWKSNTKAYVSKYRLNYNFLEFDADLIVSDFKKQNIVFDSGLSTEFFYDITTKQKASIGYSYNLKDVSYAFLESADLSFILDADKSKLKTHALFGNYSYSNKKKIGYSLGFRSNYFPELEKIKIEPRLIVYKRLLKNITLQASGELKNQVISEIEESVASDFSLENKLWRLVDNMAFPIIKSKQASIGFLYSNNGWAIDVDGYYKMIDGLTTLSLGFLNPLDNEYHIGNKRVKGVDVYAKKEINNVKAWLSYTLQNTDSKFNGINNGESFTSSTSIEQTLSTSLAYKLKQFNVAISWNWRTGKPYTKGLFNPDNGIYFDKINTENLPNYHRLDLSSTYNFFFSSSNKLKGTIGFSVRNLYNQKNLLSKEYVGNNGLNDPIKVIDKYALGITPNVLMKVSF